MFLENIGKYHFFGNWIDGNFRGFKLMKINSNSFSSLKVLSWIFFQKREKKLFCWVKLFSTWSWGVSIRLLTQPLGRCFPTKNVVWNGWECFHKKHFHLSLLRWMINKKIYLDLRNVSNFCLFTPPTNRKNYQFRQKFEHRRSRYFDASANPPPHELIMNELTQGSSRVHPETWRGEASTIRYGPWGSTPTSIFGERTCQ